MTVIRYLARNDIDRIAYRRCEGEGPGVVWVGGFRSDMDGTKASALAQWAKRHNRFNLRFDYYGHGASSGEFAHGTISRWRDDALAVFDGLSEGRQILVGSSMGGWIATLMARARPERIAALVLLAPAPDFTDVLMWDKLPEDARREVIETGQWMYRGDGDSYPITRGLIESGRENTVLGTRIAAPYPVRILQGMTDCDVPWQHAMKLVDVFDGDVRITLLKGGDHRLSKPGDLKLLEQTLDVLMEVCE